jgi:hypothetical protein
MILTALVKRARTNPILDADMAAFDCSQPRLGSGCPLGEVVAAFFESLSDPKT